MYIKKINIDSFGKLKNKEINLEKGINIIYGENECGKSTISTFIKYIFYGFSGTGKKAIDENEKKHYLSWETGSASGSVTVNDNGTDYCITRVNNGKTEDFSVIEVKSGEEVKCPEGIGEHFFKVPADVYTGSAQSMQYNGTKTGGAELSMQIQNILFSADEDTSIKNASAALSKERVSLKHKNNDGGRLFELEKEKKELMNEFDKAKRDNAEYISLKSKLEKKKAELDDYKKSLDKAEKEYSDFVEYSKTERLAELANAKKECSQKRIQVEMLRKRLPESFDDTMSEKVTVALESCRSAIEAHKKAEDETKKVKSKLVEYSKLPTVESVNADIAEYEKSSAKSKTSLVFGIIFAVLALACIPLAIFVNLFILALTAVFAALSVICFVNLKKAKTKITELSEKYSAIDGGFYERTSAISSERAEYDALLQKLSITEEAEKEADERRLESFGTLNSLLSSEIKNFDDAEHSAAELKKKITEYANARSELGNCEYALSELKKNINEEELLEIRKKIEAPKKSEKDLLKERSFYKQKVEMLGQKIADMDRDIGVLEATAKSPCDVYANISQLDAEIESETKRFEAIELAIESLDEAGKELKEGISPRIAESAEKLLSQATNGRYSEISIDKDFGISVTDFGVPRKLEYLSSGTQDLLYVAFRYGLLKLLYRNEPPIMIFDDAFSRIDDVRLSELLSVIRQISTETQTVILTCHGREAKILNHDKTISL